jgi:drug/metabolite transporter (DMT)-like permease
VEANLINYLWPLLIILLSSLLPGERLRWYHVAGGAIGFLGAALLITGGHGFEVELQYAPGYVAALVCAFTWSIYSVLSRRYGSVPTYAVGGFCGVTAIVAWLSHLVFEETVWPEGMQWLAVATMGIGPMGLAFFAWDYGVKRGNIKSLGALSYFAPLLSTLLLISVGPAVMSWPIAVACFLIIGGAILASGVIRRRKSPSELDGSQLQTVDR